MAKRSRCTCGKVKSKHAPECRACHKAKMDKIHEEARAVQFIIDNFIVA